MCDNLLIHWVFKEHLRSLSITDISNNGIYYVRWKIKIQRSREDFKPQELTLIELVSLMSLLMSKASPLSFQGLCCKTSPSPPQLYKVREGLSPSPPIWDKKADQFCIPPAKAPLYHTINCLIHCNKATILWIWT